MLIVLRMQFVYNVFQCSVSRSTEALLGL